MTLEQVPTAPTLAWKVCKRTMMAFATPICRAVFDGVFAGAWWFTDQPAAPITQTVDRIVFASDSSNRHTSLSIIQVINQEY